ncbi:MAG: deoxyribose-phosphate aldolase, partial [Bacteroidales bacterium]|nr:deoxyribose-phosphate aldolase [Bacteroidales bacterium]
MNSLIERYNVVESSEQIERKINDITANSSSLYDIKNLKKLFSLIDLTSLNSTDTEAQIVDMIGKVNDFPSHYPDYSNVAAICVYPAL